MMLINWTIILETTLKLSRWFITALKYKNWSLIYSFKQIDASNSAFNWVQMFRAHLFIEHFDLIKLSDMSSEKK